MAKKKFADGGLAGLGSLVSDEPSSNFTPMPSGTDGGARGGMQQVNQALDQISGAIGGTTYKKGGSVNSAMKSKISTAQTSGKKKSCW